MKKFIILCLITLFGCDNGQFKNNSAAPEMSAKRFFEAIYVHRNVQAAKPFSSRSIWEKLDHYYVPTSVQRHVFNLNMENVTIDIQDVEADFFRKFTSDITVTIKLVGFKKDRKWIDSRRVKIREENGLWVVYEIIPEQSR